MYLELFQRKSPSARTESTPLYKLAYNRESQSRPVGRPTWIKLETSGSQRVEGTDGLCSLQQSPITSGCASFRSNRLPDRLHLVDSFRCRSPSATNSARMKSLRPSARVAWE